MRKKIERDVVQILKRFQQSVLQYKPSHELMLEEIRMMKFKIKPIQGDISQVNMNDIHFIEIIWSLGKMDEFFQKEVSNIADSQKEVFFQFFNETYATLQQKLNSLRVRAEKKGSPSSVLEMEIFKDNTHKGKPN